MHAFVRSLAVSAASLILVGCAASAGAPSATPGAVPASPPVATAVPTPVPTEASTPKAPASVAPMAPAYVTASGRTPLISSGTSTTDANGITHVDGIRIEGDMTTSDPRLSGHSVLALQGLAVGPAKEVGWQWGTVTITNAAGSWKGTIRGAVWAGANNSDLGGYLTGTAAYAGLTAYYHVRGGANVEMIAVILPVPAPPQ